jgi:hypothetical protein
VPNKGYDVILLDIFEEVREKPIFVFATTKKKDAL